MPPTLEKRVEELERKIDELAHSPTRETRPDWRATFGMALDDENFPEMIRLGREYRRNLTKSDNGADS